VLAIENAKELPKYKDRVPTINFEMQLSEI
jgi:hypothetical protein